MSMGRGPSLDPIGPEPNFTVWVQLFLDSNRPDPNPGELLRVGVWVYEIKTLLRLYTWTVKLFNITFSF